MANEKLTFAEELNRLQHQRGPSPAEQIRKYTNLYFRQPVGSLSQKEISLLMLSIEVEATHLLTKK